MREKKNSKSSYLVKSFLGSRKEPLNQSESLKREAAEQQLLYISYERQWQSQISTLTGAPWL